MVYIKTSTCVRVRVQNLGRIPQSVYSCLKQTTYDVKCTVMEISNGQIFGSKYQQP